MARTQNTNLEQVAHIDRHKDVKLTQAQQQQWSAVVVARMNQALKARSINQVIWGEEKGKK